MAANNLNEMQLPSSYFFFFDGLFVFDLFSFPLLFCLQSSWFSFMKKNTDKFIPNQVSILWRICI